jgi:hypothetical protein
MLVSVMDCGEATEELSVRRRGWVTGSGYTIKC